VTVRARDWSLCFAGIAGAIAVLVAAGTAHGPAGTLAPEDMARIQTAVQYQIWHALALLGTAAFALGTPSALPRAAALCFALGSVLFCGGLYLLAYSGLALFAWVVPVGGLTFVAGWLSLAAHGWHGRKGE
jgi:uncharacterized membrane protein YgdD (TMEM256/DUF423 family)